MNSTLKKKIGFLSGVIFVVGSTIGSGMFVKNKSLLEYNNGDLVSILIGFGIAILGIIALAFTLKEIISGVKHEDQAQGITGWVKTYNSKFTYNAANIFMAYIYLPVNFYIMPMYAIDQFASGLGLSAHINWWIASLISLGIMCYFVLLCGASSKMTLLHNWIFLALKFLPVIAAMVIGFIWIAMGNNPASTDSITVSEKDHFLKAIPTFGILMCVPAIFFAYDGFYLGTSITHELKEPKKITSVMVVGILFVSLVYITMSVSLILYNAGAFDKSEIMPEGLYKTFQVLITMSILSVVNGYALYGSENYRDLIKNKCAIGGKKFLPLMEKENSKKYAMFYSLFLYIIIYIILTPIGYFYLSTYDEGYGDHFGNILTFSDEMGNWTSLIVFALIAIAAYGCLKNRKTNKIQVEKDKKFPFAAILSILIIVVSFVVSFIRVVYNLIYAACDQEEFETLLEYIMPVFVLLLFVALTLALAAFYTSKNNSVGIVSNDEKVDVIASSEFKPIVNIQLSKLDEFKPVVTTPIIPAVKEIDDNATFTNTTNAFVQEQIPTSIPTAEPIVDSIPSDPELQAANLVDDYYNNNIASHPILKNSPKEILSDVVNDDFYAVPKPKEKTKKVVSKQKNIKPAKKQAVNKKAKSVKKSAVKTSKPKVAKTTKKPVLKAKKSTPKKKK